MSIKNPRTYVSPRETNPFARFEFKRSHLITSIPGGLSNPGTFVTAGQAITPEIAHAAAVTVCEHATGPDEARELLHMLGLGLVP